MKYINKLNDNEILELLKPLIWGEFKEIDYINRWKNEIEINIISEEDDDEEEGEKITIEDRFVLTDYDIEIWDYYAHNKKDSIIEYRKSLLGRFGNQYALDYLLG